MVRFDIKLQFINYYKIIPTIMNSEDFKLVKTTEKFNTTELEILAKNKKFFSTDRKYIDALLEIINGESNISIRVLDWFVSNYSKRKILFIKLELMERRIIST